MINIKRLRFAGGLALRDVLIGELQNFKVKINVATGHDAYEAWREGDHDDLVLSLAMACWYGEHGELPPPMGATRAAVRTPPPVDPFGPRSRDVFPRSSRRLGPR